MFASWLSSGYVSYMAETLSIIGTGVLIIIGLFIIVLLAYAIRILIIIYSFLDLRKKSAGRGSEDGLGTFGKFIKGASVVEIILFLIRSRGRFRR